MYQVSHFLTPVEAAAKASIAEIIKGADFAAVSRKRSTDEQSKKDRSLGWIMLNKMAPPFASAVRTLKPGETTRAPVRTVFGCSAQIFAPSLAQIRSKASGIPDFVMGPGAMTDASASQEARSVSANMFVVDRNGKLNDNTTSALDVLLAELPHDPGPLYLEKLRTTLLEDLSPDVAGKITTLMQTCLEYRKAEYAFEVEVQAEKTVNAKETFTRTMALRRSFFDSDTAQALFGVQEALALYDIEVTRIQADAKLGADQKSRRIKVLHEALPTGVEVVALEPDNSANLQEQVAAMRLRGTPENDVQQLRQQMLGTEGAQAANETEQQKNEWIAEIEPICNRKT